MNGFKRSIKRRVRTAGLVRLAELFLSLPFTSVDPGLNPTMNRALHLDNLKKLLVIQPPYIFKEEIRDVPVVKYRSHDAIP